jgi:prepilin-type N-terminal cleavage/methylation domain-containing protein
MKKGFTLIELLVAMGAASIISAALISLHLAYISNFKASTKEYRDYFYSMEALMFMQDQINKSNSTIVDNNILKLELSNNITKNISLSSEGNLTLAYYEKGRFKNVNIILTNLESFTVLKKNNTIYISLTLKNGERYERCIGVNA